jgi:hypothetical protein
MRSPLRLMEILVGLLALALPVAASRSAVALAVVGAAFVALLAAWPSSFARSGASLAVIGNAITIPQREFASSALLFVDVVLLTGFLLLGAAVELGMRRWGDARAPWWLRQARRAGVVVLVAALLVLTTWLRPPGSLWLVLAGMVATLVVLGLARNERAAGGWHGG